MVYYLITRASIDADITRLRDNPPNPLAAPAASF